jgi:hypothetical protein
MHAVTPRLWLCEEVHLNHESLDDPVEWAGLVALWLTVLPQLPCAQLPKVLCSAWADVCKEFHLDTACQNATDSHICNSNAMQAWSTMKFCQNIGDGLPSLHRPIRFEWITKAADNIPKKTTGLLGLGVRWCHC